VELHFTYDEEFGGELGPGWLLKKGLTKPDLMIAAGFSYEVVTAHNGCLQMEVTVHGKMAHAAVPHTGVDALQGAVHILNALYAQNDEYKKVTSKSRASPPLPERGPHRGRHQHQRGARQGGASSSTAA
jgi:succinyl-diaminopimelate desuccinylase